MAADVVSDDGVVAVDEEVAAKEDEVVIADEESVKEAEPDVVNDDPSEDVDEGVLEENNDHEGINYLDDIIIH